MPKLITNPSLPGWVFDVRELSNGVWGAEGRHADGRTVSRKGGLDPDAVLRECMNDAQNLPSKRPVA